VENRTERQVGADHWPDTGRCDRKLGDVIESTEILQHLEAELHIVTRLATKELDLLGLELGGLLSLSAILVLPCDVPVLPKLCWDVRAMTACCDCGWGTGHAGRAGLGELRRTNLRNKARLRYDELVKRVATGVVIVGGACS
jgi:hypothetical protein